MFPSLAKPFPLGLYTAISPLFKTPSVVLTLFLHLLPYFFAPLGSQTGSRCVPICGLPLEHSLELSAKIRDTLTASDPRVAKPKSALGLTLQTSG